MGARLAFPVLSLLAGCTSSSFDVWLGGEPWPHDEARATWGRSASGAPLLTLELVDPGDPDVRDDETRIYAGVELVPGVLDGLPEDAVLALGGTATFAPGEGDVAEGEVSFAPGAAHDPRVLRAWITSGCVCSSGERRPQRIDGRLTVRSVDADRIRGELLLRAEPVPPYVTVDAELFGGFDAERRAE